MKFQTNLTPCNPCSQKSCFNRFLEICPQRYHVLARVVNISGVLCWHYCFRIWELSHPRPTHRKGTGKPASVLRTHARAREGRAHRCSCNSILSILHCCEEASRSSALERAITDKLMASSVVRKQGQLQAFPVRATGRRRQGSCSNS